jgi:hypothetical protein
VNLATLVIEAERLAGRVDTNFFSRVRRWINEGQDAWALECPWPTLLREETFVANGTRSLILPSRVKVLLWAADQDNSRPIDNLKHWDREFPASLFQNTSGAPRFSRQMGVQAVFRQPSTTSRLTFNTTVSDVFSVYVAGLALDTTASGTAENLYYAREVVNIAGTGTYTSTTLWNRIDTLSKDDYTPADLTVRDSASNLVARVSRDVYRSEYRQLDLLHIPSAGANIAVQYLTGPEPLVDNEQVPHTAVDPEFLIWYAAGLLHAGQGEEQQSAVKLARAKEILNRRILREKQFGDQDWRALPEPGYWQDEDQYLPRGNF